MQIPAEYVESAFSQLLGCRLQRLETGVAEVALTLEPHLRNRGQKLHGGAIFSLVDIAMGLACSASHGFDQQSVTIECKINYMRAVSDGEVVCTAQVLHAGRRTLVVDADVFRATSAWPRHKEPSRFSSSPRLICGIFGVIEYRGRCAPIAGLARVLRLNIRSWGDGEACDGLRRGRSRHWHC